MKTTELESDFSLLNDTGAEDHEGYPSFVKAMKGRAYGPEAINSAWSWFKIGWDNDSGDEP